jgi:hypothetical protein
MIGSSWPSGLSDVLLIPSAIVYSRRLSSNPCTATLGEVTWVYEGNVLMLITMAAKQNIPNIQDMLGDHTKCAKHTQRTKHTKRTGLECTNIPHVSEHTSTHFTTP